MVGRGDDGGSLKKDEETQDSLVYVEYGPSRGTEFILMCIANPDLEGVIGHGKETRTRK